MRKYLLIMLCMMGTLCFADNCEITVTDSAYYALLCQQTKLSTPLCTPDIHISPKQTDKGIWGGQTGKGRMYFDICLPPITPNLLIDVGMSMAQVDGVVGMAPRWFAMFSPTACPYSELYTAPKSDSSIMLIYRVYF